MKMKETSVEASFFVMHLNSIYSPVLLYALPVINSSGSVHSSDWSVFPTAGWAR